MERRTATAGPVQNRNGSPRMPAVRKGRPGVIVLIAFVVEVVAIGALANQVVTRHLLNFVANHHDRFVGHLVAAFTTYQWRISAQPGDRANEPLAHACLVLVVLALTALLVLAICRGPVTFGRAFFGTWMAVIVSTLVGQVALDAVSPPPYPRGFSHVAGPLFLGLNGFGFVAGLMLGLVTAIFAAIFAVATRRTIYPGGPAYPESQRGGEYAEHGWPDQPVSFPYRDYPQGDYSQGRYPSGYPQGDQQPYTQPYDEPYSGSYYASQVGSGTPEAGGADATQQMAAVSDNDQPSGATAPQPSAAENAPEQRSAAGGGSAEEAPANAPANATHQFPQPPDGEDVSRRPE